MKKVLIYFLVLTLSVFVIPSIVVAASVFFRFEPQKQAERPELAAQENYSIRIYNHETKMIMEMDFEKYVQGVLYGQMDPASPIEALKAQAVATRSFLLDKMQTFEKEKNIPQHQGADLCTDGTHCLAWTSDETAQKNWGEKYTQFSQAVAQAVRETRGEYMKYKDQIVKGYSFAISNGKTEDVEDVWNTKLPYLKSVDSQGDTKADGYTTEVKIENQLFLEALKPKVPEMKNYYDIKAVVGKMVMTKGGSVKNIKLAGRDFKGSEVQAMFGLRSSSFTIRFEENCVVFEVKGYGHGVGLSQAGAKYMAEQGIGYQDILKHYYQGVDLVNLYKNNA